MLERLCATVVVGAALAACSQMPHAQLAPWGLDLAARDGSVKPGDDFYRHAEGHWPDSQPVVDVGPGERPYLSEEERVRTW